MKTKLILALVMVTLTVQSYATIRYCSAQGAGAYTTINAVASASVTGDTILVGPGTYSFTTMNEVNKRLIWIGAGWDQTILNCTAGNWFINSAGANRSSVEGMRITQTSNQELFNVTNAVDSFTVRRCILAGQREQILGNAARSMTIEDCIFIHTTSNGTCHIRISDGNFPLVVRNCVFANLQGNVNNFCFTGSSTSGTLEVYNSVFLNHRTIFNLSTAGGTVLAVNNMAYDWSSSPTFGTYNAGSSFDYNASQTIAAPGGNTLTITTDPFVSYDEAVSVDPLAANFHLDPTNGAAFVNTGHPSLLDFTDGSVSDRGVYGGPKPLVDSGIPNYPWAVNVASTPNLVGAGTPINASATVRVGPQY